MTTATCPTVSLHRHRPDVSFDILRGVGLAMSLTVILVVPAALAILAALKG